MSSRERKGKSIERILQGKHGEDFAGGGGEWTFIQTTHRAQGEDSSCFKHWLYQPCQLACYTLLENLTDVAISSPSM